MSNFFHVITSSFLSLALGFIAFLPIYKTQTQINQKIVFPTPTASITKSSSVDDVANKVLQIQKQTYQSYQQCLADEKKSNPCTTPVPTCTLPTPTSITPANEAAYQKERYQAQCQLSCQKQQQKDCYNKYYANSNVIPPSNVTIPQ